ncbi:uncharacterized protein B0P05DRAFT_531372 [Gilbertella persicaria]|uniref:uncharacterized protein n=1 Tax=Gilbertella persicaria TaxID=101096 RepID=UPI00221ED49A|nr:uncharacterized protein B0P05DRAFT_531372 [Gilbertella persicaria]KAI8088082.1 hypothetical protein B0P05DRAFT_531372 [Gilbertella persicaria]
MNSLVNSFLQNYIAQHQANYGNNNNGGLFGSGPMDWLTNAATFAGADALLNRYDEDHEGKAHFWRNAGLAGALALGYQYFRDHYNKQQGLDAEQLQQIAAAQQQQLQQLQQQQQQQLQQQQIATPIPQQQALTYYYPQQEYGYPPPPQLPMIMPPPLQYYPAPPPPPFINNAYMGPQPDPYTMMNNLFMQQQYGCSLGNNMMMMNPQMMSNQTTGPMPMAPYSVHQHLFNHHRAPHPYYYYPYMQ